MNRQRELSPKWLPSNAFPACQPCGSAVRMSYSLIISSNGGKHLRFGVLSALTVQSQQQRLIPLGVLQLSDVKLIQHHLRFVPAAYLACRHDTPLAWGL